MIVPERHRDAKGRYTVEPNGPTAKVRALEAQVQTLIAVRDSLYDVRDNLIAQCFTATGERDDLASQVEELTQERDQWIADFNRCADSLRDAELTNERQSSIIARHQGEAEAYYGLGLWGIILCSLVSGVVSFLIGRAL